MSFTLKSRGERCSGTGDWPSANIVYKCCLQELMVKMAVWFGRRYLKVSLSGPVFHSL